MKNLPPYVICDLCKRAPFFPKEGGMLFGHYAVCPYCIPKLLPIITNLSEEDAILARAGPGEDFASFINRVRALSQTWDARSLHAITAFRERKLT